VSKNVAVFVDVANIFYAAKAAGVDIDYVTLLKAATAGRDFVRAYAYTGLDPENDNQRQFHAFLARSGYKVISKDIRKYGDGRIKANLDIELVVDLMKTARNLDIAVVVSGDGDFASAIRAVQEMGVRVEVISFRGNTSSDLIEAADQFTDIAQVARVEKGSARSGRRVAAEGDLSMTEVPEKETEGAPRRRRSRAAEERQRAAAAPVEAEVHAASVVVLPGERLSRVGEMDAAEAEVAIEAAGEVVEAGAGGQDGFDADGRRRRRRRGGRGRGRGRRTDEAGLPLEPVVAGTVEDDEEFEEPQPAQLPHHTFGSVWDSQIGVPTAAAPAVDSLSGEATEEEDFDEPEVPEYLLAERRQRGGGQAGRTGGRAPRGRSAYQAALDRERYGRSTPQPSFGGGGGRTPDRSRDRGRGGRPAPAGRPQRPPRIDDRQRFEETRSSSEPWSEVPPELEELLRAEMSRKAPLTPTASAQSPSAVTEAPAMAEPSIAPTAEAKPARRTRTTKASPAEEPAVTTDAGPEVAPVKPTRTRTAKSTTAARPRATRAAATDAPKKTATRRKPSAAAPAEES
jgi:uncharacterized LabA/DUF88 family protein